MVTRRRNGPTRLLATIGEIPIGEPTTGPLALRFNVGRGPGEATRAAALRKCDGGPGDSAAGKAGPSIVRARLPRAEQPDPGDTPSRCSPLGEDRHERHRHGWQQAEAAGCPPDRDRRRPTVEDIYAGSTLTMLG